MTRAWTVSITRSCAKLALSLLLLGATACGLSGGAARFEVRDVAINAQGRRLGVTVEQTLRLSRPAQRAVRNGVPLAIRLSLEIREASSLTLIATEGREFEIRFLPMSRRWQLSSLNDESVRTYPRLRHVLAELSDIRVDFDALPLAPGAYELRTRTRLDRGSLPAPMQLPALMARSWRHDSDWTQWPFRISA